MADLAADHAANQPAVLVPVKPTKCAAFEPSFCSTDITAHCPAQHAAVSAAFVGPLSAALVEALRAALGSADHTAHIPSHSATFVSPQRPTVCTSQLPTDGTTDDATVLPALGPAVDAA
jgi:hypothetical protein